MQKIREVLRLAAKGLTHRQIGRSLSISHNTAAAHLRRAESAGIDAAGAEMLDDAALVERIFPPASSIKTTGRCRTGRRSAAI